MRRTEPPHSGQTLTGASDIDWNFSNLRRQARHSYSYVGIRKYLK